MEALRVAVVGAGGAGQAHAFGYRNVAMRPGDQVRSVELAAIVDPARELAGAVAERYGFGAAYDDIGPVLADPAIEAVSVAVPNHLHSAVLPPLLRAGKHVLTEKPLGRSVGEARELARMSRETGCIAGVGFSFRRLPGLAALAEVVTSGALGPIYSARAWFYCDYALDPAAPLTWRYSLEAAGGGAIVDVGSHAIDALQFAAGPIAEVVAAELHTVIPERPLLESSEPDRAHDQVAPRGPVTNDDLAVVLVRLAGGGLGHIEVSRVAAGIPFSLGVSVFGATGHARFDSLQPDEFTIFEPGVASALTNGPRRVYTGPQHSYVADVTPMAIAGAGTGYGAAFIAEIQEFVGCVTAGHPMSTDFETAAAVMAVIDAAQRRAAEAALSRQFRDDPGPAAPRRCGTPSSAARVSSSSRPAW